MESHVKKYQQNFFIPIILYIDKTVLTQSGKLSIHPVQMSLGILTEKCRRSHNAWRPLGYLANDYAYFSESELGNLPANLKNERLHIILNQVLQSFKYYQSFDQLNNFELNIAGNRKMVNLYVPLAFIIGDAEGGDQLCSWYMSRNLNTSRLC